MTALVWLGGIAILVGMFIHVYRRTKRDVRKPIYGPDAPRDL